jgi:hypothetical protein
MVRKPRTPKCRYDEALICCHLSSEMDGCDRFGISRFHVSGFLESRVFCSSNSRFPILRWNRISPRVSWSDGQDDVGISQGKNPTVSSRGLNLENFLPDLTVVGPLHKIGRLKCFCPFRALLVPSGLVSRLGTVRRTNVTASMAVLRTWGAFFTPVKERFVNLSKIWKKFTISSWSASIFDRFELFSKIFKRFSLMLESLTNWSEIFKFFKLLSFCSSSASIFDDSLRKLCRVSSSAFSSSRIFRALYALLPPQACYCDL